MRATGFHRYNAHQRAKLGIDVQECKLWCQQIQKNRNVITTAVRLEWEEACGDTSGVLAMFYFLTYMQDLWGFALS